MSESPSASCDNCGSDIPGGAKFCPECGALQDARSGDTVAVELPPEDLERVPVNVVRVERRYFGVTPGLIRLSRASRRAREQAATALETVSVRSAARRRLLALRTEIEMLQAQRLRTLAELGDAVYRAADDARDAALSRVREIDAALAAREEEMRATVEAANRRIHESKLEVAPTQAMPAVHDEENG